MKKRYLFLISFLIVMSVALVTAGIWIDPFLDAAGDFLIIEDEPLRSDLIFVPSGKPAVRFAKAVSMLKAGMAERIVIIVERKSEEKAAFQSRYGDRFSNRAVIEHIARAEALDPAKVVIPPERSRSTREDLELLQRVMKKEKATSVIITTTWHHLRRCQLIARRILGEEIKVYYVPANKPTKNHFISRPKRIMGIFNAYLKLGYYYLTTF
jgi:uncharacterized SAM-binding protein YcdF (DUF218 family)